MWQKFGNILSSKLKRRRVEVLDIRGNVWIDVAKKRDGFEEQIERKEGWAC